MYSDMVYLVGFFVFILGTAMGSFINVVVDRVIRGETLGGRSHCDYCKKTLMWYDLIPLISYIVLRGKCRRCHKQLSIQYLLVELATGVIYVVTWLLVPFTSVILYWGIVSCAWIIYLSDLRYKLISDYMQIAFFIALLLQKLSERATLFSLLQDVFAGIMVCLPIGLIYIISNERAMGLGDVILAAIIGFSLGIGKGLLALYISFLIGGIIGVILLVGQKKGMKSAVPFGPFLLMGMLIVSMWGSELIAIVRGLYRL